MEWFRTVTDVGILKIVIATLLLGFVIGDSIRLEKEKRRATFRIEQQLAYGTVVQPSYCPILVNPSATASWDRQPEICRMRRSSHRYNT